MISAIKNFLKIILRNEKFIFLWVYYTERKLVPLFTQKNRPKFLVLNSQRFMHDLGLIEEYKEFDFVSLPIKTQVLLNALSISKNYKTPQFILAQEKNIIRDRINLRRFLKKFLCILAKRNHIQGILTCSFYYPGDQEWDRSCEEIGLPHVAIYKENLKYITNVAARVKHYQEFNYKYKGSALLVYDQNTKNVLTEARICDPEKIHVVGVPRLDHIFQKIQLESAPTGKIITLFSFRHAITGVALVGDDFNSGFSKSRKSGAVKLFDEVHGIFAELAMENPEIKFLIRPKWIKGWGEEIAAAIKRDTNLDVASIKNLEISDYGSAHEVMKNSMVVVGINSTALLEARLYRKWTIIPVFAEMCGDLKDKLYFSEFLNDFVVAQSRTELKSKILKCYNGPQAPATDLDVKIVSKYLGYFDGKNGNRVVSVMKSFLKK